MGKPVGWWLAPPAMPRAFVSVRLGFFGMLLLSPLILSVLTFVLAIWMAKFAVLLLALFTMAIVELANAYEAWTLRHADETSEEKEE